MAAKVGNKLWVPKVSSKITAGHGVMMIGIENYGVQEDKGLSLLSYCSNSDRECSQFYSNYIVHRKNDTKTHMNDIVFQCLSEYQRCNSEFPTDLIIMKNGSTKYDNSTFIQAEINEA